MTEIKIRKVTAADAPLDLLLQADPSKRKVRAYLADGYCHTAVSSEITVGVYVIRPCGNDVYELMNISVAPEHQQKGIGTKLLHHCIATARELGSNRLDVCTGTFGYQLAFYQKAGFRVDAIIKDFFLTHYEEPIFEEGVQLKDMLRLSLIL